MCSRHLDSHHAHDCVVAADAAIKYFFLTQVRIVISAARQSFKLTPLRGAPDSGVLDACFQPEAGVSRPVGE